MVIDADLDRIAGAPPVDGFVARAGLRDGSDIDDARLFFFGLCEHGFDDVIGSREVDAHGGFGLVICRRRNHAADVKDNIGACHAFEDIVIIREIAPDDFDFVAIRCELFMVDFGDYSSEGVSSV